MKQVQNQVYCFLEHPRKMTKISDSFCSVSWRQTIEQHPCESLSTCLVNVRWTVCHFGMKDDLLSKNLKFAMQKYSINSVINYILLNPVDWALTKLHGCPRGSHRPRHILSWFFWSKILLLSSLCSKRSRAVEKFLRTAFINCPTVDNGIFCVLY